MNLETIISSVRVRPKVPFECIGSDLYFEMLERRGVHFNFEAGRIGELVNLVNINGEIYEVQARVYEQDSINPDDVEPSYHVTIETPADFECGLMMCPVASRRLEDDYGFRFALFEEGDCDIERVILRWRLNDYSIAWAKEWIYKR